MTLSNVFIGKKVVQQIYLNNAIIYQSKGWETLPCAPTEVWTKTCASAVTSVRNCAVDQDNNLYIATYDAVYKVNSDGILIWKKDFKGSNKICIDKNNNIYLAALVPSQQTSNCSAVIYKIDADGNIIASCNVTNGFIVDKITDFAVDSNSLYISMCYTANYTNYFLFKIDNDFKTSTRIDIEITCLATTNESPYLYCSAGINLYRIEKKESFERRNLINVNSSQIRDSQTDKITNIVVDSIGNVLYDTQANGARKYDPKTQKFTIVTDITNNILCLDYQQNLYSFAGSGTSSGFTMKLIKISSDLTVIYNCAMITTSSSGILYGTLTVDNNGNIYFIYKNDQQQMIITKMINVIKKG